MCATIYDTTCTTCTLISDTDIEFGTTDISIFDIVNDDNGIAEFTIVHQGCTLYLYVVPILYYDIQYLFGCNNINTTICDNNNSHSTACFFFLSIEMEKKIDNTGKIDDNKFGSDHCAIMRCNYVNNIHIHSYDWIPKTKKDSSRRLQSSLSMIMTITMVASNQVHVCDDVLYMLDNSIYNTPHDVDYKPFHIIPESNYHHRALAFNTNYNTERDNNHRPAYQVHQSLFYIYGADIGCDHNSSIGLILTKNVIKCEVSILFQTLDCGMIRLRYVPSPTLLVSTTIMMIENNQGEVYDDIIPMIVDGIHDTNCDGDYESFHHILKSNSLDRDRFEFDSDRELAYSNRFESIEVKRNHHHRPTIEVKKNRDLLRFQILLLNFVPLLTSNPVQVLLRTIEVPTKKFKVDESPTPLGLRVPILMTNSYQVRALAFDTKDITARDINKRTKY